MIGQEQHISLKQGTDIIITPRLQQAIALLQLSTAELMTYVNQQLLENPLLEEMGESFDGDISDSTSNDDLNDDWNHDENSYDAGSNSDMRESSTPLWRSNVTFNDHLTSQIRIYIKDPTDQTIAFQLMECLDENGFLDEKWEERINNALGMNREKVEKILTVLQTFDPVGIFARSVKESLIIQLKAKDHKKIYANDCDLENMMAAFDALKLHPLDHVCKRFQLERDVFQNFLSDLRTLEFRPAQTFESQSAVTSIAPDILVSKSESGILSVRLNPKTMPKVLVNSAYYHDLKKQVGRAQDLDYLKDCFSSANWLLQSLQKRSITLLQVASEIVEWQKDFLGNKVGHMKAMSLKDISQKAGVHESTVSRVTTSKYIQTPRGLMNLKDFFTNTVGESINAASAIEIQTVLKGIIADESRDRPLSDEDLVMHLESKGLSVARRTIAKYRTNLGIASSSSRKRHYQIQKQTQRQRNQFLQNENFLV